MMPLLDSISAKARLPLVEMSIPALCQLSGEQYHKFCETVRRLVEADVKISLFEFALQRMLLRQLHPHFVKHKPPAVKHSAWRPLLPSCACLLSSLAHAGNRDPAAAQQAFVQGVTVLARDNGELSMIRREQCGLKALAQALDYLAEASPPIKKRVLQACAACINADGQVTVAEAELLRVIAISLDCPMPPLLE